MDDEFDKFITCPSGQTADHKKGTWIVTERIHSHITQPCCTDEIINYLVVF